MIPALRRLPQAPGIVDKMGYFVVHAPRQTGKTTALRALAHELTATGQYAALHFSCELGQAAGDDYGAAQRGILDEIRLRAELAFTPELYPPPWPPASEANLLTVALTAWARACPRPLVSFFYEIDALLGQSLISVLRQLRAGFNERPTAFPASVALCGLFDPYNDDIQYVADLGLIAPKPPLRIANPIYREVIVRVLAANVEFKVTADPRGFVLDDGRLA